MISTPSRSSSVPVKRSRIDLSPHSGGSTLDRLQLMAGEIDMPPYMKLIIDVLDDTRRQLMEVNKRNEEILQENKRLREENSILK
ncbi:toxin-antitoxin system, toxin component, MazF domain protein, partial [Ostertagia ostertagi]